jgi:hypothetical protein
MISSSLLKLTERPLEEIIDGGGAVGFENASSGAGDLGMGDLGIGDRFPCLAGPALPFAGFLVENEQGFVAQLCELGSPAGAALDRAVFQYLADDLDFLAVVDLVPDALQDFPEDWGIGKRSVHQLADVRQADIALLQFLVRQYADTSCPGIAVSLECKVDLFDAVSFGGGSKSRLGSVCRSAV